jgi:hypothetical protein
VKRIDAITKIWAAGVQGSPLGRIVAEAAGGSVDRAGRVQVHPDLTLPGHPEVFVVGDVMSLDGLPGVAQVAIQSGRHAAQTIVSRIRGDTTERPFVYSDKGTLATISRFNAVASVGRVRLSGFLAWILWLAVPPHRPDRLQEPDRGAVQLDGRLPRPRPPAAHHHHTASLRPPVTRIPSRSNPHPKFQPAPKPANHGPIRTSKESHPMTTRNDTERGPR